MNKKILLFRLMGVFLTLCTLCGTLMIASCTPAEPADDGRNYVFVKGELTVRIGSDAKTVLDALGTPNQYSESPSCLFDGLDKVYAYGGFRIQTYPDGAQERIYSVELLDDSVATPEGIAIGSARADVIAAYGSEMRETASALIYTDAADGTELMFSIRDGRVTNIQYKKITD